MAEGTSFKPIIIIAIVILGLFLVYERISPMNNVEEDKVTSVEVDWQETYSLEARVLPTYSVDTADTLYYDYEDSVIVSIANNIALEAEDSEEAMKLALEYVYDNVRYVYDEPDNACFTGTAPSILQKGEGQCDTQSITLIALLRKMGIAARPVGGCVVRNPGCGLQAVLGINKPKYTELTSAVLENEEFSRTGGLHAWVEAWHPEKGWIALEETTGQFADTDCYIYHVELYPSNEDKKHLCVSTNQVYAQSCFNDDISGMNEEGVGVV